MFIKQNIIVVVFRFCSKLKGWQRLYEGDCARITDLSATYYPNTTYLRLNDHLQQRSSGGYVFVGVGLFGG